MTIFGVVDFSVSLGVFRNVNLDAKGWYRIGIRLVPEDDSTLVNPVGVKHVSGFKAVSEGDESPMTLPYLEVAKTIFYSRAVKVQYEGDTFRIGSTMSFQLYVDTATWETARCSLLVTLHYSNDKVLTMETEYKLLSIRWYEIHCPQLPLMQYLSVIYPSAPSTVELRVSSLLYTLALNNYIIDDKEFDIERDPKFFRLVDCHKYSVDNTAGTIEDVVYSLKGRTSRDIDDELLNSITAQNEDIKKVCRHPWNSFSEIRDCISEPSGPTVANSRSFILCNDLLKLMVKDIHLKSSKFSFPPIPECPELVNKNGDLSKNMQLSVNIPLQTIFSGDDEVDVINSLARVNTTLLNTLRDGEHSCLASVMRIERSELLLQKLLFYKDFFYCRNNPDIRTNFDLVPVVKSLRTLVSKLSIEKPNVRDKYLRYESEEIPILLCQSYEPAHNSLGDNNSTDEVTGDNGGETELASSWEHGISAEIFTHNHEEIASRSTGEGTLIVFCHGLKGRANDFSVIGGLISVLFPDTSALFSEANEDCNKDIMEMGQLLLEEIDEFIEKRKLQIRSLSIIAHSLGAIIARAAVAQPGFSKYYDILSCFISFSGPHIGNNILNNKFVGIGLKIAEIFAKNTILKQLSMKDARNLEDCNLYKIANSNSLGKFENIILCSGDDDSYSPPYSAGLFDHKMKPWQEQVKNLILENLKDKKLIRLHINFGKQGVSVDSIVGREAHVSYFASERFVEMFVYFFSKYFIPSRRELGIR